MRWWRGTSAKRNRDLDKEVQSHIEMAVEDRIDHGAPGSIPRGKGTGVEMPGWAWMSRLAGDMRYALRQLSNSRGFAATAILTLALAIGANSAIFTLVHAILLRELPFKEPSRVFSVENASAVGLGFDARLENYTASFNAAARSFKTIQEAAMYSSSGVNADLAAGIAQRLKATETSAEFLKVLGVTPDLGRGFMPEEDVPGKDHVVLISDRLWRDALHADPAILGKTVKINGFDFAIVGVLPPHMDFPAHTDLWTPTIFDEHTSLREAGAFFTSVIVRGRENVPADTIRAEFRSRVAPGQEQNGRARTSSENEKPVLTPIAAELTKSIRSSLLMLTAAVSFVLLIACVNVACLFLVRTAERRNEFAVRAALGAGRGRLIQQQLVESTFVALAGGALGVFIARSVLHLLYVFRPAALNSFQRPAIDTAVLAFTAAIAIFTGLTFGIVPAWLAGHEDPAGVLKSGVWRTSARGSRLRKVLVAAEMGIAFVLLVGAGLLLRTLANMDRVPLGYNVKGILSFSVSLHGEPYVSKDASTPAVGIFYSTLLDRLAHIPGVNATAAVSSLPLDTRADMLLPVTAGSANQTPVAASPRFASSGYFGTMGIPFIAGRDFSLHDNGASPKVVIVTRDLAEKLWPGQSPIGRQMHCLWYCKPAPTVVGVVSSNRRFGPRGEVLPEYYMPYTQQDWEFMTFVLRAQGNPAMLIPSVRRAVAAVDSTQPIYDIETMQQRLDDNESLVRFELFALGVFAFLAVLLVSIGLYGVISYTVTQRRREIGLRIALGAQRTTILIAIVREGALIALAGTVLGLGSSLALMKLLTAVLFGVTAHDSITLGAASMLFLAIAIFASYLPAHRAASIDPALTLRSE